MVWEPQAGQCGRSKDRSGAAQRGGWRGQSSDGPIRCVKNAGLQPRRARLTWKDCCEYRQRCVWAHRTQGWREAERNREQRDFSGRCLMPLPTSASSAPARRPSVLPWPPAWPWEAWAWAVLGKEPAGLPGMSLALPSTKRFPSHLTPVRHLQSRLRRGLDRNHRLLLKVAHSTDVLVRHVGQCRGTGVKRSDCWLEIQIPSLPRRDLNPPLTTSNHLQTITCYFNIISYIESLEK